MQSTSVLAFLSYPTHPPGIETPHLTQEQSWTLFFLLPGPGELDCLGGSFGSGTWPEATEDEVKDPPDELKVVPPRTPLQLTPSPCLFPGHWPC